MVHGVVILKHVHKFFDMSAIRRWSPSPPSEYGRVVVTRFCYEGARSRGKPGRRADPASPGLSSWRLTGRSQHRLMARPPPGRAPAGQRGLPELQHPGPALPSGPPGARRRGVPPNRARAADVGKTTRCLWASLLGEAATITGTCTSVHPDSAPVLLFSNSPCPQDANQRTDKTHLCCTPALGWLPGQPVAAVPAGALAGSELSPGPCASQHSAGQEPWPARLCCLKPTRSLGKSLRPARS